MPRYRGTIYKYSTFFSGAKWSNVYTIDEASALEALDVLNAIAAREKAISYNNIIVNFGRVVNVADKNDSRSFGAYGNGDLSPTGLGGPLPLFNTVRVTFHDTFGKPEQKYLRVGANEANLTLGEWDGEFITFIRDNYVDGMLAQTQYVGPGGEHPVSATVSVPVQNRQLGWHRRTRPGFHRGWVPD